MTYTSLTHSLLTVVIGILDCRKHDRHTGNLPDLHPGRPLG